MPLGRPNRGLADGYHRHAAYSWQPAALSRPPFPQRFLHFKANLFYCDSYCKASKGKLKINMKKYCKKDYAVQIHVLKAEKNADWWKFTVNIISVYKQGSNRIRRGDQTLWIHSKDIACKCPKIKPMKKYLLLGNNEDSPDQSGIIADKTSLVIQWRDTWARRLRKFQQREKKGKCKKA
ncbi:hypothetical protein Nmel_016095 [Mimus melanotis]